MTGIFEKLFIRNELSRKRWLRFKKNRTALVSVWILSVLLLLSLTAEFWANSKPHLLKYQGQIYVPLFKDYHPTVFGRDDIFVMDYRSLELKDGDWWIWPVVQWDPFESNTHVDSFPSAPTTMNWFGTDDRGRDVLTRLIYGLRYTFAFALGCWILTYFIGCLFGAVVGYIGGKVDLLGMRFVEIVESLPTTLILITIVSIFNPNLLILILFVVVFGWTVISQYMRAQFLALRNREYVEAARAIGASHWRIITKHILPNALTPIVTFSPFAIAGFIYTLSFLDYLGFGVRPPTPSWGEQLAQAQKYFTIAEWLVWAPASALLLTLTLLINIGLAIRDAFDSKSNL